MSDCEVVYYSEKPYYRVPYVGPIGYPAPIILIEVNGVKTTILLTTGTGSNLIPEEQVKHLLPNYLTTLKSTEKKLYWMFTGEIIGEIDLEVKVGMKHVSTPFCVVRNAASQRIETNPYGLLLLGGMDLMCALGAVMQFDEPHLLIKIKPKVLLLPPWPVKEVRDAAIAKKWTEIEVGQKETDSGLVRFVKEGGKWMINIRCSTGAVQTTLELSTKGSRPLDRTVRDMEELIAILDNPRTHAQKGNRRRNNNQK